jgi:1-acyl-sn-glycerol-3-phosphate acyltransferase
VTQYAPLLVIYRASRLLLHLGFGIGLLGVLVIVHGGQWHTTPRGMRIYQWWMGRACSIIAIRITQYGKAHRQTALHAANHVSFLDIPVIAATTPARFLSKHSVRYWPVIGFLTTNTGTVFIHRGKRSAVQHTRNKLVKALSSPRPIVFFPEATTTCGENVQKFHTGLFQSAIDTQTPVQPVAIRYLQNGKLDRTAAYIDKDNFLVSLLKIISRPSTEVHLAYCPLIDPASLSRHELAELSRESIMHTLNQHIPA